MGGEGSMAAANVSLKNNRNQLAKRKNKNALSGSYANVKMKTFPEVSPEELIVIRKKIRKENKQVRLRQLIIFVIFILSFILFFFYLIQ